MAPTKMSLFTAAELRLSVETERHRLADATEGELEALLGAGRARRPVIPRPVGPRRSGLCHEMVSSS